MGHELFKNIKFFVINCKNEQIVERLIDGDAVNSPFLSESVRFAISDEPDLVDVGEAEEVYAVPVVKTIYDYCKSTLKENGPILITPDWVADCISENYLLQCSDYHPDLLIRPQSPKPIPPVTSKPTPSIRPVSTPVLPKPIAPLPVSSSSNVNVDHPPLVSETRTNTPALTNTTSMMTSINSSISRHPTLPGTDLQAACSQPAEPQILGRGPRTSLVRSSVNRKSDGQPRGQRLPLGPRPANQIIRPTSASNDPVMSGGLINLPPGTNLLTASQSNTVLVGGQSGSLLTTPIGQQQAPFPPTPPHHQPKSKAKSIKHSEEQNLNEEEKDAIVMQNVKNILSFARSRESSLQAKGSSANSLSSSSDLHTSISSSSSITPIVNQAGGCTLLLGGKPPSASSLTPTSSTGAQRKKSPKSPPGKGQPSGLAPKVSPKAGTKQVNLKHDQPQPLLQSIPIVLPTHGMSGGQLFISTPPQSTASSASLLPPTPAAIATNAPLLPISSISGGSGQLITTHRSAQLNNSSAQLIVASANSIGAGNNSIVSTVVQQQRSTTGQTIQVATNSTLAAAHSSYLARPSSGQVYPPQQQQQTVPSGPPGVPVQRSLLTAQFQQPTLLVRTARPAFNNEQATGQLLTSTDSSTVNGIVQTIRSQPAATELASVLMSTTTTTTPISNSHPSSNIPTMQSSSPHQHQLIYPPPAGNTPRPLQQSGQLRFQLPLGGSSHNNLQQTIHVKNPTQPSNIGGLINNIIASGPHDQCNNKVTTFNRGEHSTGSQLVTSQSSHTSPHGVRSVPGGKLTESQQQHTYVNTPQQQPGQQQIIFQSGQHLIAGLPSQPQQQLTRPPPPTTHLPTNKTTNFINQSSALPQAGGGMLVRSLSGPPPPSHLVAFSSNGQQQHQHQQLMVNAGPLVFHQAPGPSNNQQPAGGQFHQASNHHHQQQFFHQSTVTPNLIQGQLHHHHQQSNNSLPHQQVQLHPKQHPNTMNAPSNPTTPQKPIQFSLQQHQPAILRQSSAPAPGIGIPPAQSSPFASSIDPQQLMTSSSPSSMVVNRLGPNQLVARQGQQTSSSRYHTLEGVGLPASTNSCLVGCVMLLAGYQPVSEGQREVWRQKIRSYGAEVDLAYHSNRITHLVIDCLLDEPDLVKQALSDQVRLVTIFWLNDVITAGRIFPPQEILHLPCSFSPEISFSFVKSQLISLTGFVGDQRQKVEVIIRQIGASFTSNLDVTNTILVCLSPTGAKYEAAQSWGIPCVNSRWLHDLYFADMTALTSPLPSRYLNFGEPGSVDLSLNLILSRVKHMMHGWLKPIQITQDTWNRLALQRSQTALHETVLKRRLSDSDVENQPSMKKTRLTHMPLPDLTQAEIDKAMASRTRIDLLKADHKLQVKLATYLEPLYASHGDTSREVQTLLSAMVAGDMETPFQVLPPPPPPQPSASSVVLPSSSDVVSTAYVASQIRSDCLAETVTATNSLGTLPEALPVSSEIIKITDSIKNEPMSLSTTPTSLHEQSQTSDQQQGSLSSTASPIGQPAIFALSTTSSSTLPIAGADTRTGSLLATSTTNDPPPSNTATIAALTNTTPFEKAEEVDLVASILPVRLIFTAMPVSLIKQLSDQYLPHLPSDCEIVDSIDDATHLVACKLTRTPKTYKALAKGLYLVSPRWIQASALRGEWLAETDWLLADPSAEFEFGVNLRESILRSRRRQIIGRPAFLFYSLQFYVAPSTQHRDLCLELIAACGGFERNRRPTQKMALLLKPRQLIICNEDEGQTAANYLMRMKGGRRAVHHEEFILSAVMRQEVDYDAYQLQHVGTLHDGIRHVVSVADSIREGNSDVGGESITILPPPTSLNFDGSEKQPQPISRLMFAAAKPQSSLSSSSTVQLSLNISSNDLVKPSSRHQLPIQQTPLMGSYSLGGGATASLIDPPASSLMLMIQRTSACVLTTSVKTTPTASSQPQLSLNVPTDGNSFALPCSSFDVISASSRNPIAVSSASLRRGGAVTALTAMIVADEPTTGLSIDPLLLTQPPSNTPSTTNLSPQLNARSAAADAQAVATATALIGLDQQQHSKTPVKCSSPSLMMAFGRPVTAASSSSSNSQVTKADPPLIEPTSFTSSSTTKINSTNSVVVNTSAGTTNESIVFNFSQPMSTIQCSSSLATIVTTDYLMTNNNSISQIVESSISSVAVRSPLFVSDCPLSSFAPANGSSQSNNINLVGAASLGSTASRASAIDNILLDNKGLVELDPNVTVVSSSSSDGTTTLSANELVNKETITPATIVVDCPSSSIDQPAKIESTNASSCETTSSAIVIDAPSSSSTSGSSHLIRTNDTFVVVTGSNSVIEPTHSGLDSALPKSELADLLVSQQNSTPTSMSIDDVSSNSKGSAS